MKARLTQLGTVLLAAFAASASASDISSRGGIGLQPSANPTNAPIVPVHPERSLAITDVATLQGFTALRIFDQLAAQNPSAASETLDGGLSLFQSIWHSATLSDPTAKRGKFNCDLPTTQALVNNFPYRCPRNEGVEATNATAFSTDSTGYQVIGLFNRFDLADASSCGEYRIVLARRSGASNIFNKNLVILEANLPNPRPAAGLNGCVRVAEFWRDLSFDPSVASRRQKLEHFYFDGIAGFSPVVHINNYGVGSGSGQIRTDQFMPGANQRWLLREFKLALQCRSFPCQLVARPNTVAVNPQKSLFNGTDQLSLSFQSFFLSQVSSLAVNDLNRFDMKIKNAFNGGDSISQSNGTDVSDTFYKQASSAAFKTQIQGALNQISSTLTPDQILDRAQALTCGGCHQTSNNAALGGGLQFPASLTFTHVDSTTVAGLDGPRFVTSSALNNVFLPHRKSVLENFLATTDSLPRCMIDCSESFGSLSLITQCSEICQ